MGVDNIEAINNLIKKGYDFTLIDNNIHYVNVNTEKQEDYNLLEIINNLSQNKLFAMNYISTLIKLEVDIYWCSIKQFVYTVYDYSGKPIFVDSLIIDNIDQGFNYINKKFIDNPRFENIVFRCSTKEQSYIYIGSDSTKKNEFAYLAQEVEQIASPWD